MTKRPATIICDIDGTLVKHGNPAETSKPTYKMELLPGALEKVLSWESKGYNIILLTGRRASIREMTIKQLAEVGIVYDQLITGVGGGTRVLINDRKLNGVEDTAFAICMERNTGMENIWI